MRSRLQRLMRRTAADPGSAATGLWEKETPKVDRDGRPGDSPDAIAPADAVAQEAARPTHQVVPEKTLAELSRQADIYSRIGIALVLAGSLASVAFLVASWHATIHHIDALNRAKAHSEMLVLLLARGIAFGSLGVFAITAIFLFARACLDQSARFRKRWFSAPVFNEAMRVYVAQQDHTVSAADVIALFDAWNRAVESPFASMAFKSRRQQASVSLANLHARVGEADKAATQRTDA
ncbi:hypothetical protein [Patulibacter sp. SYSU D01012]|uniref:hypothetical protein n=1 Tax=Patulibacter sp. SYSU D01012 TaxID=2817381 RepID=UPI001B3143B1|nr:hypothetical protein [Patulibacter sp. SYSU D01012]